MDAKIHLLPDGVVELEVPYNKKFLADFKRRIPEAQRVWDAKKVRWRIQTEAQPEAVRIMGWHYQFVDMVRDERPDETQPESTVIVPSGAVALPQLADEKLPKLE